MRITCFASSCKQFYFQGQKANIFHCISSVHRKKTEKIYLKTFMKETRRKMTTFYAPKKAELPDFLKSLVGICKHYKYCFGDLESRISATFGSKCRHRMKYMSVKCAQICVYNTKPTKNTTLRLQIQKCRNVVDNQFIFR